MASSSQQFESFASRFNKSEFQRHSKEAVRNKSKNLSSITEVLTKGMRSGRNKSSRSPPGRLGESLLLLLLVVASLSISELYCSTLTCGDAKESIC